MCIYVHRHVDASMYGDAQACVCKHVFTRKQAFFDRGFRRGIGAGYKVYKGCRRRPSIAPLHHLPHMCIDTCIDTCTDTCTDMRICLRIDISMHALCLCVRVCVRVCACIHVHAHAYAHARNSEFRLDDCMQVTFVLHMRACVRACMCERSSKLASHS